MPANDIDEPYEVVYERDNVRNGIRGTLRVELHRRGVSRLRMVFGIVVNGVLHKDEELWMEARELLDVANAVKDVMGR